jgi:hypothetical protein
MFQPSGYTAGPIYQHTIGTFNTCSRGPIHRSLTDTGGGYNNLRAPPGLKLSNLNIASSKRDMKHLSPTSGLSTTQRLPRYISTPSNDKHLINTSKVIKGKSEGVHNVTMVLFNSYQPNAHSFLT